METDALGTQVSSRPQTTSKTRMAWLVRLLVLVPMMDVRGFEVADDRGGRTPPTMDRPDRRCRTSPSPAGLTCHAAP
jgi:hypothetical protein